MRKAVAGLVAVQLALLGVYLLVEAARVDAPPFATERLDEAAPALIWERPGASGALGDGVVLVHFWATWCAPCVAELPTLLDAAKAEGIPLLAVTDEPWPAVERYFDGVVPEGIVRDPTGDAALRWSVSGLPDTFVVADRRLTHRMGGPRAWATPEARAFLRGAGSR